MTVVISKSEAIEIKRLEQVSIEWLENAKKRNLAPYI